MVKYILISGTLAIAGILASLSYVNYLNSPEPTACQKKVTEASYVAEIANSTGRLPISLQDGKLADVSMHSNEKFTVDKNICF